MNTAARVQDAGSCVNKMKSATQARRKRNRPTIESRVLDPGVFRALRHSPQHPSRYAGKTAGFATNPRRRPSSHGVKACRNMYTSVCWASRARRVLGVWEPCCPACTPKGHVRTLCIGVQLNETRRHMAPRKSCRSQGRLACGGGARLAALQANKERRCAPEGPPRHVQ
jgi:hypothetical protein